MLKGDQQIHQQTCCNCGSEAANCPVKPECKTKSVVYEASIREKFSGKTETHTQAELSSSNTLEYNGTTHKIRVSGTKQNLAKTIGI